MEYPRKISVTASLTLELKEVNCRLKTLAGVPENLPIHLCSVDQPKMVVAGQLS